MRAFVLSGGGNRGALQVGALKALLEYDFYPDMIVGCSAGALNASFLAREISLQQVERLADSWRYTSKDDIYPGGAFSVLWRLVTGEDSLFDNSNFYEFIQRSGVTPAHTFGDLPVGIPIYITATHLDTERLHVFGDDPNDRLLDALMASTALPPMHPPWTVNGERYIDGGTVTPLPIRVAIERGATEIFALHIWEEPTPMGKMPRGVTAMINRSISTMLRLQAAHDVLLTEAVHKQIKLHEIRLGCTRMPDVNDWSQSDRLYATGYELTRQYLNQLPLMKRADITQAHPPLIRLGHVLARGWLRRVVRDQGGPVGARMTGIHIQNSP